MKAAVLNAIGGRFVIEDVEIDAPKGREILVEVKASGLCHTDLHYAQHDFGIPTPVVFGHEIAGIVKELGPDADGFVIGDHVVATLLRFCGDCEECLGGKTWRCLNAASLLRDVSDKQRITRNGQPITQGFAAGGFAEYVLMHQNQLVKLPKQVPFPQASLLGCGCVTGAGAVINAGGVTSGDVVVVMGAGGVGLNVVSGARVVGAARIIVVDLQPAKEALARKFGATDFVCAADGDPVAKIREMTGGRGATHSFDAVGNARIARQAIDMLRKGGTFVSIGVHQPGSTFEINPGVDMIRNEITIKGTYMGSTNIKHDIPLYADLYLQGRFNLDDLVSKEISLDEINEAYAEVETGMAARSVITRF